MEVYLDRKGELAYSIVDSNDTVVELAEAVERFCQSNISCSTCSNTCCSGFVVFADNIFLANLDQLMRQSNPGQDTAELLVRSMRLDPVSRKWFVPQGHDGKCQYLSHRGRCLIYEIRPLVCRLHVCRQAEKRYRELKDNLYYAYHEALKIEMARLLTGQDTAMPEHWVTRNPLLGMVDYSAAISEISDWAKAPRQRLEVGT